MGIWVEGGLVYYLLVYQDAGWYIGKYTSFPDQECLITTPSIMRIEKLMASSIFGREDLHKGIISFCRKYASTYLLIIKW